MAPLTLGELQQIVIDSQTLVGSQLQEVFQSGEQLALGFYHNQSIQWLWFDLNPNSPFVVRTEKLPPHLRKETKPLGLFIKSHFVNSRLKAITTSPELGRIIEFHFPVGALQARLFPHGQNFIATAGEKTVSFTKPKELPKNSTEQEVASNSQRRWEEIEQEWKRKNRLDKSDSLERAESIELIEKRFRKDLDKKEKALEKMKQDLADKEDSIFREAGEYLKTISPKDFPDHLPKHFFEVVNQSKSISANIEHLFKKAKDNERKLEGSKNRIAQLQTEINEMKLRGPSLKLKGPSSEKPKRKSLLEAAEAKGRKFHLSDDLEVFIGKSAGDNLALLRKAQPFDYWIHLRDYPGSHAILRRTRNRIVTDQELQIVGKWVVEQSLHKTPEQLLNSRFDLLLVECRYVRPIKGDKLGRVNYSNDRVFVVRF